MAVLSGIMRVLTWLVYIAIAAALLMSAPLIFGYQPVVVLSGSMEPAYPVGSILYYKSADFEEINEGDVITFAIGEGSYATHRVVEKDRDARSFITKGDNNPSNDVSPVEYDRVAGKALGFAIPYAGYFKEMAFHWYTIAIAFLIILAGTIVSPAKENKKTSSRESRGSREGKDDLTGADAA